MLKTSEMVMATSKSISVETLRSISFSPGSSGFGSFMRQISKGCKGQGSVREFQSLCRASSLLLEGHVIDDLGDCLANVLGRELRRLSAPASRWRGSKVDDLCRRFVITRRGPHVRDHSEQLSIGSQVSKGEPLHISAEL